MVKELVVDPAVKQQPFRLKFKTVRGYRYDGNLRSELAAGLDPDTALRIFRDMVILRRFEEMLQSVKQTKSYSGVSYSYGGPAHLAIGQEAAAVGEALHLRPDDHIFGSHRSHEEILAKGLSAFARMDGDALAGILDRYQDGRIRRIVGAGGRPVREEAVDVLLYGLLTEILGKETGFNRGMGGSMHAFWTVVGAYPNNAIVGGSADISVGAALYKRYRRTDDVVVCNIGDGATGCGPTWEAMNFASMAQFTGLWDKAYRGGLPVIFAIINNFYAMGGQTEGETMAYDRVCRMGAGVNPDSMHAETVNGNDPLAVADAFARALKRARKGKGPVLLDLEVYRQSGHSPSDASSYRTSEELDMWKAQDPVLLYRRQVADAGLAAEDALDATVREIEERLLRVFKLAIDPEISPILDMKADPDAISPMMLSHEPEQEGEALEEGDVSCDIEDNAVWRSLGRRARFGIGEDGKALSPREAITIRDALFEATISRAYRDRRMIVYGEENRDWGGAFGVYKGLTASLPYHRLFNAPISEGAIVGTAVGFAMEGGRPLVELMYCDFLGRAGDEIFNQLAKWQGMSAGELKMPVVLRVSVGNKYGAQHSQDWAAMVAHVPGLQAVFPATPYDAKGLLCSALASNSPTVFFESQRIYDQVEIFHTAGVPREEYMIPLGLPDVKRPGTDITILSFGATLYRVLDAADRLASMGLSAEIVDGRSIVPFDYEPVIESLRKTHRLVVTSDACERNSFLNTVAANVALMAMDELDAPVGIVGSRNWVTPSVELEDTFFPHADWILDEIHTNILPLPGYAPTTDRSPSKRIRDARLGV